MSKARAVSLERVARVVVYFVLGSACVGLVASGRISTYLHPRMSPWICVAGVIFLALCMVEVRKGRVLPRSPLPAFSYYSLLLVIVGVMEFPDLGTVTAQRFQAPQNSTPATHTSRAVSSVALKPNDDQYWHTYNALYDSPQDFAGKEMTVAGFVYREKRFPAHSALVGRNLMWCCAADMGLIGFMATGADMDSLPAGTWVEITGLVNVVSFSVESNGKPQPVPFIKTESLQILHDDHPSQNIFARFAPD